ncbi:hypothetical protein CNR22_16910 [Sphingobacteriaceae bacterium]|nr:hypothetical protein CNR22_16910 [Sphingobacteriaceae bacterium]
MDEKKKYLFFSFFVVLNIILKCLCAGDSSYSYDEMISVKDSFLDFGHIKHESEWDNNPPFYYYCLWVWHQLLPINEFNSRLLSVLFSSLSIGFSFLFALKKFNYRTAMFSAVLLTLSNFLLFYSIEARTYSLVVFLTLLSSLQYFKFVEKSSWANLLLLSLLNFLLIYSHYISGIVLIVQYLITLIYYRKNIKHIFGFHTILIISLVLLRFTKKQFLNIMGFNQKGDFWLKTATWNDLKLTFLNLFDNRFTAVCFLIIVFLAVTHFFMDRKYKPTSSEMYCLFLGFGSILVLFFTGLFKAVFLDRYLIFCIPFATMLVCSKIANYKNVGLLFFGILLLIQLVNYKFGKTPTIDFRTVADLVKQNEQAGDYKVINTKENRTLFGYYYYGRKFLNFKNIDSISHSQNIYGVDEVEALEKINFSPSNKIFLIQSFHKIQRTDNPIKEYLLKNNRQLYSNSFSSGIEFTLLKNVSY